jgi:hypothetical protein
VGVRHEQEGLPLHLPEGLPEQGNWSQQILLEDSKAVSANKIEQSKSRALAAKSNNFQNHSFKKKH